MMAIGTGTGPPDLETAIRQAERYPFIFATIGVHPHDASKATPETFARLRQLAAHPKVLAIGEIGLDYHYDFSPRDVQQSVFRKQLEIAAEAGKPVVIHSREAWPDTMALGGAGGSACQPWHYSLLHRRRSTSARSPGPRLSPGLRRRAHISQRGAVREAARITPEDRLLLETDCPYLAPVPHRGQRNEPAFVVEVARRLAEVRGCTLDEIAAQTTRNFERLCLRRRRPLTGKLVNFS
jgi:TatD DNase family protein